MARITFVASYSLAQHPAIRNRLVAYMKEGLAQGHSVRLISPDKVIPASLVEEGLEHIPIKASSEHRRNFITRAFSELIVAWRALAAVRTYRDEDVVVTIPSMFLLFLSPLFAGSRWYLDARDLTWEYFSDRSLLLRPARMVCRFLAKRAIKHYRCVVTTNETDYDCLIADFGASPDRSLLVYNGVSGEQFRSLSSIEAHKTAGVRSANGEQGHRPIVVSYIGNVGRAQNLTTLVQAAKYLPHVMFNIVGAGSDFGRVCDKVAALGLTNVKLWGRISWDQIPEIYAASDVLYAQLSSDYDRAMPSKLYEYLCTGRYIVYGGGSQAGKMLLKFENYDLIPPDDVQALVDAVSRFEPGGDNRSLKNKQMIKQYFIRENNIRNFYACLNLESAAVKENAMLNESIS